MRGTQPHFASLKQTEKQEIINQSAQRILKSRRSPVTWNFRNYGQGLDSKDQGFFHFSAGCKPSPWKKCFENVIKFMSFTCTWNFRKYITKISNVPHPFVFCNLEDFKSTWEIGSKTMEITRLFLDEMKWEKLVVFSSRKWPLLPQKKLTLPQEENLINKTIIFVKLFYIFPRELPMDKKKKKIIKYLFKYMLYQIDVY